MIRSPHAGAAQLVAGWTDAAVVNAGDGKHEHPTQALLDVFTLRRRLGSLENTNIWIVGDVLHSRVARSDILAFTRMGARVTVCGPPTLIPREIEALGCEATPSLDRLEEAEVVYVLRMQHERMREAYVPSLREYAARYQINERRLNPGQLLMHPGPGQPRGGAVGGGDRLPAGADRRAGQGRGRGADGRPLRAAGGHAEPDGGGMSQDRLFRRPGPPAEPPDPRRLRARPAGRTRRAPRRAHPRRPHRRAGRARIRCPATTSTPSRPPASTCSPASSTLTSTCARPGQEYKEDLDTGTAAAAAGGYCAVIAMPNTDPTVDNAAVLGSLVERAAQRGPGPGRLPGLDHPRPGRRRS